MAGSNAGSFQAGRLAQAIELAGFAYEQSAPFRARMDSAGLRPSDLKDEAGFAAIPVIRKKELLGLQKSGERFGGLLTCDIGRLRRVYQSPGPIYDPEGRERDFWGWTEAFEAAGFVAGDLVQMTFSYHLTPAGLMLEEPLHEIGCAVIPAGPGNTGAQIELMTHLPVTGFVGMTSFLKIIGEKALKEGLDPKKDFGLRVAFVAAERLSESLRREVEELFGMVIRQGYGTADVGCIAYECRELGGMHATSRGLIEICDPVTSQPVADGEIGEVVFTPFCRQYPIIRLATGDLSRFEVRSCACGRGAPKLAGILGRVDDTAKVKGQFVYPSQAAEALAGFPEVRSWQLVVENPGGKDKLVLKLSVEGTCDEAKLTEAFTARCKLRPVLCYCQAEEIPEGSSRLVDNREFD